MKTCTKCKVEQDEDNFSVAKRNSDGSVRYRASWCKQCKRNFEVEKRGRPKVVPVVTDDGKECLHCHELKLFTEFSPSSRGRKGYAAYCKSCISERLKDCPDHKRQLRNATQRYRDRHRERWRARHRLHQFNRKSLIRATDDGTVTDEFVKSIYATEVCCWCGKWTEPDKRTLEHLVELSQGGKHSASNIRMACLSCNSARKGRNNDYDQRQVWDQSNRSDGQYQSSRCSHYHDGARVPPDNSL